MVEWVALALALFALGSSGAAFWLALTTRELPAETLQRIDVIEAAFPRYRADMAVLADHCEQVLDSTESKRKRFHSKSQNDKAQEPTYGDFAAYKAHLENGGRVSAEWERFLDGGR